MHLTDEEIRIAAEALENLNPDLSRKLLQALPVQLVNATGHDIFVMDDYDRVILTLPASTQIPEARVDMKKSVDFVTPSGVPIFKKTVVSYTKLPEPSYNTYYIVSSVYAINCTEDRDDLLVVGRQVRDPSGRVLGCHGLTHAY